MNFEDKLIITLLHEGRLKKAVKKTGSWLNKKLGIVASPEESRKMAHLDRVLDYREGGASEEEAQSLAKKDQDEIDNLKQNETKKIPARGATPPKTINVDYVNVTKRKKREAVEDEAREKVRQRTQGTDLSPTQIGKRMGRAVHWAGSEYIRRGTDVNEGGRSFQDKLISVLLSEEHWTGKQKKEREKSKRSQQWRTFKYKTKSGKPATLQVQKRKHQEQQYNLDDFEQPVHNIKRTRVTKPVPSWKGMKGKMVHHTTSQPQTSPHSLWQQGNPDTNLIAPKSIKKHTTVTAKIPGGKQVRNKRFPTSHDKDD